MGLNRDVEGMSFDVRLLDWNTKYGVLTPNDIKKHRETLPDLKDAAVTLQIDESPLNGGAPGGTPAEQH